MIKWALIALFLCSVLYTHYRGKVRHKWLRQSTDHSTFMAPINALMTLFSSLPDRPYHDLNSYPEVQALAEQWEVIRDEALALQDKIKASDKMDDAGFNSFFRRGWTRFYLKWYGEAVIFDETYIHWAANQSEQNRIILFCDLERKMKWRWAQAINQWFSRTVMAATTAPNDRQDRTGGVNRAFKHIYAVRREGKKLKARNKPLYYIVKWSVLLALVAGIILI